MQRPPQPTVLAGPSSVAPARPEDSTVVAPSCAAPFIPADNEPVLPACAVPDEDAPESVPCPMDCPPTVATGVPDLCSWKCRPATSSIPAASAPTAAAPTKAPGFMPAMRLGSACAGSGMPHCCGYCAMGAACWGAHAGSDTPGGGGAIPGSRLPGYAGALATCAEVGVLHGVVGRPAASVPAYSPHRVPAPWPGPRGRASPRRASSPSRPATCASTRESPPLVLRAPGARPRGRWAREESPATRTPRRPGRAAHACSRWPHRGLGLGRLHSGVRAWTHEQLTVQVRVEVTVERVLHAQRHARHRPVLASCRPRARRPHPLPPKLPLGP